MNTFPVTTESPPAWLSRWIQPNVHPQTDLLKELSGDAQLELAKQRWTSVNLWEKRMLKVSDNALFRREIIMHSHGYPCWYARTMIPKQCFMQDNDFFESLYTGTLTPLIFGSAKIQRKKFFYYALNEECQEYYWIKSLNLPLMNPFFARFSEYSFQEASSFWLLEILLPDLMRFA